MTKSAIVEKCGKIIAADDSSLHRLNRCQAYYWESLEEQAAVLVSYKTACAVYWCGVVWEFGRWSNTTTKHVRKFARLMDAPVVSLYRHSGMSLHDYYAHDACDWYDVIFWSAEHLNPQTRYDYSRSGLRGGYFMPTISSYP